MTDPRKHSCVHAERIALTKSRSFFKNQDPDGVVATFLFMRQLCGAT